MPRKRSSDFADWYYRRHDADWEGCGMGPEDDEGSEEVEEALVDRSDAEWYYHRHDADFGECNDPNAPVDPPHVMLVAGLILVLVGGLLGFGLLIDVAPATAIKTWLMWSGAGGVVLGVVLAVVSIIFDRPAPPPSASQ